MSVSFSSHPRSIVRNFSFLTLVFMLGCPKPSDSTPEPKPAAPTATASKPAPATLSFVGLDTEGLSKAQLSAFTQFAQDEICPCDCPKTFAGCLETASACKPAVLLAQWVLDRMKDGVSMDAMSSDIAKEINDGFMSKPRMIDLSGYEAKGSDKAPITIVEFADFECVHCKAAAPVFDQFIKDNPNSVHLIFKFLPLRDEGKMGAIAVEAAGKQGKFWKMHETLFRSSGALSKDLIMGYARAMGLNMDRFEKDMADPQVIGRVEKSLKEAKLLGLMSTPSVFFNGRPYNLAINRLGLELRLKMEEARSQAKCN